MVSGVKVLTRQTEAFQKQANLSKRKNRNITRYPGIYHMAVIAVVRKMREADLTAEPYTRRSSPEEPHKIKASWTNAESTNI